MKYEKPKNLFRGLALTALLLSLMCPATTLAEIESDLPKAETASVAYSEVSYEELSPEEIVEFVLEEDQELAPEALEAAATDSITEADTTAIETFASKRLIVLASELIKDYGADKVVSYEGLNTYLLQYESEEAALEACTVIRSELGESACYTDSYYNEVQDININAYPTYDSNMNLLYSWGTEYMEMNKLRDQAYASNLPKVKVAVIDTGLDVNHQFFKGRTITTDSYDFIDNVAGRTNMKDTDEESHGTHVTGLIVDATPANVQIMALRTLGDSTATSTIIAAFNYAIEHGADVINASLFVGDNDGAGHGALDEVLTKAKDKGIVVVASSGNGGNEGMVYPASSNMTVAVGSIEYYGDRSSFSSYASNLDFVAPGSMLLSAVHSTVPNATDMRSGTSMATPEISAAYAYLKMFYPDASTTTLYNKLKGVCKDLGPAGKDMEYGNGVPIMSKLSVHKHTYTYTKSTTGKHIKTCSCGDEQKETCRNYKMSSKGTISCKNCGRVLASKYNPDTHTLTFAAADKSFICMRAVNNLAMKALENTPTSLNIVWEEGYTSVDVAACADNYRIASLRFPATMEELKERAFYSLYSENIKTIDMSKTSITTIGNDCFTLCFSQDTFLFPKTLKFIGSRAFFGCGIKELDLSKTALEAMGFAACADCSNLERVALPSTLKEMDYMGFFWCQNLAFINLENTKLTAIRKNTFSNDIKLKYISIPKTVKTVESGAFSYCSALSKLYFKGDWPTVDYDPMYPEQVFEETTTTVYGPSGNSSWNKVLNTPANYQYGGKLTFKTYTVKDIASMSLSKTQYYYDGSVHYPSVTVKNSAGNTLCTAVTSSNFYVKLTNSQTHKKPGTYTVTAAGRVAYSGSLSKKYSIVIKPTTLTTLTGISKGFTVNWTKLGSKYVSGYQLQYSTSKTKLSNNEGSKVLISGSSTASKKLTGRLAGKTYYVKIRTYKTISGTRHYSKWSSVKSVKTK